MSSTLVDRSDEDAVLYDPLTGLPGRLLQRAHLVHALRRADRNRTRVAVLFLDVEDFADLNRRLGEELADQVLIVLAARIQAALRDTDMTCRLHGDEFAVVCEDVREERDLAFIARRIMDAASVPMRVGDHAIEVRVTTGMAMSSGSEHAGDLLRAANEDLVRVRVGHRAS